MNSLISYVGDLANFGAAGLMGAMWLWERKLTRRREEQLNGAHERICRDEERLKLLTEVVDHNTAAVTRFVETQRQMVEALNDLTKELLHGNKN